MVALHRRLASIDILPRIKSNQLQEECIMRKMKIGILLALAILALVSVASALPASTTASVYVQTAGPSYFKVTTATGDSELPAAAYDGWCAGLFIHGVKDQTKPYAVYSSLGDVSTLPDYIKTTNWNKVNWILNNPNANWKITQAAMWKVEDGAGETYPSDYYTAGYSESDFNDYMNLVNAQGTFVPGEKQYFAAIMIKEFTDGGVKVIGQPVIVPTYIAPPTVPEFPTLALPIGMLIGLAGVVEYVREKKE
jgi:hypothetical protein